MNGCSDAGKNGWSNTDRVPNATHGTDWRLITRIPPKRSRIASGAGQASVEKQNWRNARSFAMIVTKKNQRAFMAKYNMRPEMDTSVAADARRAT